MYAAMLLADARLPSGGHAYRPVSNRRCAAGWRQKRSASTCLAGRGPWCGWRPVPPSSPVTRCSTTPIHAGLDAVLAAWAARTRRRPCGRPLPRKRGLLRLAGSLWPGPVWPVLAEQARPLCRAVVIRAIAAASEMSAVELVRTVIYDDAARAAAAALLKLDPCDPAQVSRWVLDACAAAEPFVVELAALIEPAAIPAAGAPQTEGGRRPRTP